MKWYNEDEISIHAPAKGATSATLGTRIGSGISIHAPAKGATLKGFPFQPFLKIFQSTLPRRERQDMINLINPMENFNPRSREGSDCDPIIKKYVDGDFNPRSREGSDRYLFHPLIFLWRFQSTLPRRERQLWVFERD